MPGEQLIGEEGEVFAWHFKDSRQEAEYLVDLIARWAIKEQLPLSEIAILVSKQLNLYANHLMTALEAKGIPFRNEQQMQDITAEPAARIIVDYLSCIYGQREPKAWMRLMDQLVPFADEEIQTNAWQELERLIKKQKKAALVIEAGSEPYSKWWESVQEFLEQVGIATLVALSPDYEAIERLKEVVQDTKVRIQELLRLEPDLPLALERFSDDQAVRILTIHKSKGLEFDTVILLAVENETFFGDQDANRCAFFVGVSRAKRRLGLTYAKQRERPDGYTKRWDVSRSMQSEYFGYSDPFVQTDLAPSSQKDHVCI